MSETKPGYKTTEFWVTIAALVISGGVSLGILPADTDVQQAASVVMASLVAMVTLLTYITGRNRLKEDGPSREELLESLKTVRRTVEMLEKERGGPRQVDTRTSADV